ncbi:NAD(P)H-hydrate dehydratase [Butyricicoccus sp.]|uniref:NAD(P)H-hydrate dehydratase n=1 Tax=Butyricicoccus sp. TaxID=2049021 RepID=UPI003D7EF89B
MKPIDWAYLTQHIRPRAPESDKNTYGRVLAICGCRDYIGAPFFAAQAAVRTGSGIVTLALPACIYPILAAKLNEPTFLPLETGADGKISAECLPSLARRAAILAGPGLGISAGVTQAIQTIVEQADCPLILDADGINALAGHIDIVEKAKYPVVLTPHKHEFARICDVPLTENREEMASAFARKHHCVLLLKGHRTIIAGAQGELYQNVHGNPGMSKGGSGDVLSGIILSLLGQGLEPLAAAACGAYIHSRAGDLCANDIGEFGMTPTDMLGYIPRVLKPLNSREW